MSTTNTGGPAFPVREAMFDKTQTGMTLRDYFAAKAMQSLLIQLAGAVGCNSYEHRIADAAYKVADAMLKARGEQ